MNRFMRFLAKFGVTKPATTGCGKCGKDESCKTTDGRRPETSMRYQTTDSLKPPASANNQLPAKDSVNYQNADGYGVMPPLQMMLVSGIFNADQWPVPTHNEINEASQNKGCELNDHSHHSPSCDSPASHDSSPSCNSPASYDSSPSYDSGSSFDSSSGCDSSF